MKVYRMKKCSHGTTMVEDPFDGEWVPVADANKMIDLLTIAFNELCSLQTRYADALGISHSANGIAIQIDSLLQGVKTS